MYNFCTRFFYSFSYPVLKQGKPVVCKKSEGFMWFPLTDGKCIVLDKSSLGTLSRDDDDGSENITKKMNLRPSKLYRVYVGDFFWS